MPKCIVVLRKFSTETHVSTVIGEPNDSTVDDVEHYLRSEAQNHIRRFCQDFPEFKPEMFSTQITEIN